MILLFLKLLLNCAVHRHRFFKFLTLSKRSKKRGTCIRHKDELLTFLNNYTKNKELHTITVSSMLFFLRRHYDHSLEDFVLKISRHYGQGLEI